MFHALTISSWDRRWGMGSLGFDLSFLAHLKIKYRKTGEENSPSWIGNWFCYEFHIGKGY